MPNQIGVLMRQTKPKQSLKSFADLYHIEKVKTSINILRHNTLAQRTLV